MKIDSIELCECCNNCNREHHFTKNNTFGTCLFMSNKISVGILEKIVVDISKFNKCRYYLRDEAKYAEMSIKD